MMGTYNGSVVSNLRVFTKPRLRPEVIAWQCAIGIDKCYCEEPEDAEQ